MSFAALLLELGLTRLFSVVLFYHFAFLAISIALLGLGAGAVFAYLRRQWLERWSISASRRGAVRAPTRCRDYRCAGSCRPQRRLAASELGQLLAPDCRLSRVGGTVLHYRPVVLDRLRAASRST